MIMRGVVENAKVWNGVAAGGIAYFGISMDRKISADRKVSGKINSRVGK